RAPIPVTVLIPRLPDYPITQYHRHRLHPNSVEVRQRDMPMKQSARVLLALAMAATVPAAMQAHFKLVEPASWIAEDQRGDPQKLAPCGGLLPAPANAPAAAAPAANAPQMTKTNTVTKVTGGSKIHLKVEETIFHPGHYRVALAVNSREELP